MTDKHYLIHLAGGGDTTIHIVNEATWDWINLPYQGNNNKNRYTETVPSGVMCNHKELEITSGSYDNDRALAISGQTFWTMKDAYDYIKNNNITIEDEYEGYIY